MLRLFSVVLTLLTLLTTPFKLQASSSRVVEVIEEAGPVVKKFAKHFDSEVVDTVTMTSITMYCANLGHELSIRALETYYNFYGIHFNANQPKLQRKTQ